MTAEEVMALSHEEKAEITLSMKNSMGEAAYVERMEEKTLTAQANKKFPTHLLDGPSPDLNALSWGEAFLMIGAVTSQFSRRQAIIRGPLNIMTCWRLHKFLRQKAMDDRGEYTQGISIFSQFHMGINTLNVAKERFNSNPLMLVAFAYTILGTGFIPYRIKALESDDAPAPGPKVSVWAHSWAFLSGMGYQLIMDYLFSAAKLS